MRKFGCMLVYLKYWTLSLTPLMVYPEVLFGVGIHRYIQKFSIGELASLFCSVVLLQSGLMRTSVSTPEPFNSANTTGACMQSGGCSATLTKRTPSCRGTQSGSAQSSRAAKRRSSSSALTSGANTL